MLTILGIVGPSTDGEYLCGTSIHVEPVQSETTTLHNEEVDVVPDG